MEPVEPCRLAVWDDEALAPFVAEVASAGRRFGVVVERLPRPECVRRLRAAMVDAALVPAIDVLVDVESFEVYPPAALSAWCAPHASIHLPGGLGERPATLSCPEGVNQEALMARIVLREHYGMQPEVLVEDSISGSADGVLRVRALRTPIDPEGAGQGVKLDLGQEWFELTAYPMVWGLFVSLAGTSDSRVLLALREAVGPDGESEEEEATIDDLVSDSRLRFRFDDVVTASLTELSELLFFYKATVDVPDPRYVLDPEADDDEEVDDDGEFRI